MTKKSKGSSNSFWKALQPKTQNGRLALGMLAVLCVAGSAYYAGISANQLDDSAREFVQRYQSIDQTQYRANL